jgi:hypothetical protein
MAFIRTKTIKGHTYYYLVKNVRQGRKVRQKHVMYLGKNPTLAMQKLLKKEGVQFKGVYKTGTMGAKIRIHKEKLGTRERGAQ